MPHEDVRETAEHLELGTPTVLMRIEDQVGIITLNRPERLNALTFELLDGLERAWRIASDRADVRVVVFTGAGRAFCAGADIDEYLSDPVDLQRLLAPFADLRPDRGLELRKPVIAAVDGVCFGGGLTLLLATDIRFASARSRFATPETGWGVLASFGGTQRLLRQIPHAVALSMLLGGDVLQAEDAIRHGLVSHVVEGDVRAQAIAYAKTVAERSPLAAQATKELALRAYDTTLSDGIRMEDLMVRLLQDTEDAKEGIAAWQEKRAPRFRGC
ncbi:enoyl-CoA hydratase/isomerase family protein [Leucobacter sp. CSA1]|uniref:Enoyl-CoA hydratase/isomerase family protein n=1 Tax=Leucobacter chromiisoli TaxID=2796471 RepID=A0A934Q8K3_9MICO|nr:enoyl-CoA hydratase/isomerase family protein [Leucobacter chromiisoli]MBK0418812.1 enoyl-CoA hydratase/isomerase family protein [Leucobacter chromiisoli]